MHYGISESMGGGGLKYGSRPWLGMDIFWNCPMQLCSEDTTIEPCLQCKCTIGAPKQHNLLRKIGSSLWRAKPVLKISTEAKRWGVNGPQI